MGVVTRDASGRPGDMWVALFRTFDFDQGGQVDLNEFLKAIRGVLNAHRRGLVEMAYARFDVTRTGEVTVTDLRQAHDPSHHLDFVAGTLTAGEVCLMCTASLGDNNHDGVVSKEELLRLLRGLSSNFDIQLRHGCGV